MARATARVAPDDSLELFNRDGDHMQRILPGYWVRCTVHDRHGHVTEFHSVTPTQPINVEIWPRAELVRS